MIDEIFEKCKEVDEDFGQEERGFESGQDILSNFELRLQELMYEVMDAFEAAEESEDVALSRLQEILKQKLQEVEDYPEHPWGRE